MVLGRSGAGLNKNANGYTTWVEAKGAPARGSASGRGRCDPLLQKCRGGPWAERPRCS